MTVSEVIQVKKEPVDNFEEHNHTIIKAEKREHLEISQAHVKYEQKIKTEIKEEFPDATSDIDINEESNSDSNTSDLIEESDMEVNHIIKLETPIKNELKPELLFEESMTPSPFNKELFRHFNIKNDSPQLKDETCHNSKSESRKSVKRTVFQRDSPYKRYYDESSSSNSRLSPGRMSAKERLGPKIDDELDDISE